MRRLLMLSIVFMACVPLVLSAQPGDETWEVLYDGNVTIRLKGGRFTAGSRRLAWLLEAGKVDPKAKNAGPEFLDFREEKSTLFKDGITTFVPVASLQRLEYDHDKKLVRAVVKQASGKELILIGSTTFVGINKFSLEGTALKADVGVAGTLQFQDGLMKVPIRGYLQPGAKPVDAVTGRAAVVIAQDKEKTEHKVHDLTPLYAVGKSQQRARVLMFQKVGQLDVAKLATLRQLPAEKKNAASHDYEVTQVGGDKERLTLLEKTQLADNQPATLIGLVGRVAAGFKLFPPHTVAEVRFE